MGYMYLLKMKIELNCSSSFKVVFNFCCVFVIELSSFPVEASVPFIDIINISIVQEFSPVT